MIGICVYAGMLTRGLTSLPATYANRPIIAPEIMPTIGPTQVIIKRGESGSGIVPIIAASLGWFAMY